MSPTIIVGLSISPFSYISSCFMYFNALLLGAYMFMIVMSSWRTETFCPSLFLIFLVLKSAIANFLLISVSVVYLSLSLYF